MNPLEAKHIYCIGIGGIGISALAKFFAGRGVKVSGTDLAFGEEVDNLRERGITVTVGEGVFPDDADLVIYSSAVDPEHHSEMRQAKERNVPMYSYTEMLGLLMQSHYGIAVSGTNGKTTTTALLGRMLEMAGKDPTVIVGGHVTGWDRNLHIGHSDLFVAEGCEYKRNMLNLHPKAIVLTNVTADHLDYYKDLDDIIGAFSEYVSRLPEDGLLVYNHDDPASRKVRESARCRAISYGYEKGADVTLYREGISQGKQYFTLEGMGMNGMLTTVLPGQFNIANIAAAGIMAHEFGVSTFAILQTLNVFAGTWRRFECVGVLGDMSVISDYAHHPQAVEFTITAAKELFEGKKVLFVFQPHQRDRTIKLFDDFVKAFDNADEVIISEIYEVKGRNEAEHRISSKDLVEAIQKHKPKLAVTYAADLSETLAKMKERAGDFGAIVVMGAGDIDTVARKFVTE